MSPEQSKLVVVDCRDPSLVASVTPPETASSSLSLSSRLALASPTVRDRTIVLVTPGRREEQVTAVAFQFLQEKGVAVSGFTHGQALRTKTGWEVVFLELRDPPIAGGSATVRIGEPSLRVENWALGQ